MKNLPELIKNHPAVGKPVMVFNRHLFAVPVRGVVTAFNTHDDSYKIDFDEVNPGTTNVTKHNGSFFFQQECVFIQEESPCEEMSPFGPDQADYNFNGEKRPSCIQVYVENEDEEKIVKYFLEAFLLRKRKGRDYGDAWKGLGIRKEYVYLYDKVMRLKRLIWEGRDPANESTKDSLIDMLNYSFHTLILLEDEIKKKKEEEYKQLAPLTADGKRPI